MTVSLLIISVIPLIYFFRAIFKNAFADLFVTENQKSHWQFAHFK